MVGVWEDQEGPRAFSRKHPPLDSSLFQVWFLWSKSTVPAFLDKEEVVQIFGENPEEGEKDEETQDENNKSGENT